MTVNERLIDLHCHTSISDNSFTTREVILMAKEAGVSHLAITDHDTTIGLQEAMSLGKEYGVTIIPGIEISAYDFERGSRAHILGLYVQPGHASLSQLCDPIIAGRHAASQEMVARLVAGGYGITWEQVQEIAAGGTGVYKQHIMHALLNQGYTTTIYGELYKKLFRRGENGNPPGIAYVPSQYVKATDAIRAIVEAGGVPVLAHPGQFDNFAAIPEWKDAGLAGVEVLHPLHDSTTAARARNIAETLGLLQTGGSDFHGFYTDTGSQLGTKSIGAEHFQRLQERAGQA